MDQNEAIRAEHRNEAARPFVLDIPTGHFSSHEVRYLQQWGSWLWALWSGRLTPYTDAQRHFVRATSDEVPATTWSESLWRRYLLATGLRSYRQKDLHHASHSLPKTGEPRVPRPSNNSHVADEAESVVVHERDSIFDAYGDYAPDVIDDMTLQDDVLDDGLDILHATREGVWPDQEDNAPIAPSPSTEDADDQPR